MRTWARLRRLWRHYAAARKLRRGPPVKVSPCGCADQNKWRDLSLGGQDREILRGPLGGR
jgi:hypothetical protein